MSETKLPPGHILRMLRHMVSGTEIKPLPDISPERAVEMYEQWKREYPALMELVEEKFKNNDIPD